MSTHTKILLATTVATIAAGVALLFPWSLTILGDEQPEALAGILATGHEMAADASVDRVRRESADRPDHRRLVFDYTATLRMDVAKAEQRARTMSFGLAGELVQQDVAAEGDDRIVEVTFPRTKLSADQATEAKNDLGASFARPTHLRLGRDGSISAIAFDAATPDEHKNWIRAVIAALHWTVDREQTAWVRCEADAAGIAEVAYTWTQAPTALEKHKRAYQGNGVDRTKATVSGHGTATYDGALGCVCAARYDESSYLMIVDLRLEVRTELHASMRLQSSARAEVNPRVAIACWEPMDGEKTTDAIAATRIATLRARAIEGVTLSSLLTELEALLAQPTQAGAGVELSRCMHRLGALFELRPDALSELRRTLDAGQLVGAVAETALSVAAHVGSPAAQSLLRALLASGSQQALAVHALFSLQHPDAATVQAVADVAAACHADAQRAAAALFVAGCLAGRADAAGRAVLLARLADAEAPALARGELGVWFDALGNAKAPEVCQLVAKYRHSAEDAHRAGAMIALRGVLTDDATGLLIQHATSDAAASVRCQAAEFLAQRSDARALATVDRILFSGDDAEVQRTVMRVLAARIAEPPMLARVQQGTTHRDAEVQRLATAALARS